MFLLDGNHILSEYCDAVIFFYPKLSFFIFRRNVMEAVAQVGKKPVVNQCQIEGVIRTSGTFEVKGKSVHETVIVTPAPDLYSMPGVISVQSKKRLGNKGDDVSVFVTVTGIPNSWTDRNSGELKESANVRLVAVE